MVGSPWWPGPLGWQWSRYLVVASPFMALAFNLGLPRVTQLDQKSIQVWTLYAREGRMRQDRAGPFFAHTNDALARSSKSLATPLPSSAHQVLTPWLDLDACLSPPVVQPLAPGQSLFDRLEHVSCRGIGGIQ